MIKYIRIRGLQIGTSTEYKVMSEKGNILFTSNIPYNDKLYRGITKIDLIREYIVTRLTTSHLLDTAFSLNYGYALKLAKKYLKDSGIRLNFYKPGPHLQTKVTIDIPEKILYTKNINKHLNYIRVNYDEISKKYEIAPPSEKEA